MVGWGEMVNGMSDQPRNLQLPGGTGLLNEEQTRQLRTLLSTLTPEQALWMSGYLAGVGQALPSTNGHGAVTSAAASSVGGDGPQIRVLYATETGNAEGVAKQFEQGAVQRGLSATAVDMADYRIKELRNETHVVLVAATHGEGDPPDPAAGFFEFLWSRKAPKLEGTVFSVLSLGDSSYVEFCKAGKDLDERFEELGAERLLDRVDCDIDYEDHVEEWIEELVGVLEKQAVPAGAAVAGEVATPTLSGGLAGLGGDVAVAPERPAYTRRNPYRAEILESIVLNGRESGKETRHIELLVEEGALPFEPGDSLGIIPENEDAVVGEVLEALGLSGEAPVEVGGEERRLSAALRHDLELTLLTPGFLKAYAEAAEAEDLQRILEPDNREGLNHFMACNQVPDILRQYPVSGLDAQEFVGMLRKLQPRLYSIASSEKWMPDQIDLTVAVTRFTADGKRRNGVASTYLSERREPGDFVEVYVDHNKGFKLPSDPTVATIMIGPGTGVAPFRAFLQEREEVGASGSNWLFFGDRTFREDFLYQTEWQRFLKDGLLTRMDVAFSRDQAEKVYVQHRIQERSRDLFEWLEEGAYLYVCGDADGMAPAVEQTLTQVIRDEGGHSEEDAEAYLRDLRQERRYQRDVY